MTVQTSVRRTRLTADGILTDFDFGFKIYNDTELLVYIVDTDDVATLQTITTHYTVAIDSAAEEGTVTFVTPPTDQYEVLMIGSLPYTQGADIPVNEGFSEVVIKNALDKLEIQVQQLKDLIDRTVSLPLTSAISSVNLPEPEDGKALVWDGEDGEMTNFEIDVGDFDAAVAEAEVAQAAAEAAQADAETAQGLSEVAQAAAEAAQAAAEAAAASMYEIESGMSIIWTGAISAIPSGYVICDGANSTPDYTDRFVIHADADAAGTNNVDDTGGVSTHAITVAELAIHNHTDLSTSGGTGEGAAETIYNEAGTTGNAGSGSAHTNRDKYYASAYIMKT